MPDCPRLNKCCTSSRTPNGKSLVALHSIPKQINKPPGQPQLPAYRRKSQVTDKSLFQTAPRVCRNSAPAVRRAVWICYRLREPENWISAFKRQQQLIAAPGA